MDSFWNITTGHLLSGAFTVIGGVIPLVVILVVLFYKTRANLRKGIPDTQQYIEQLRELLTDNENQIRHIRDVMGGIRWSRTGKVTEQQRNLLEAESSTFNSVQELKLDILKNEQWIKKVESHGFLDWIGHYFRKVYFSDFFQK